MEQRGQLIVDSKLSAKQDLSGKMLKTCGAVMLYAIPMVLLSVLCGAGLGIRSMAEIRSLDAMHLLTCTALYLAARLLILEPLLYGMLRWLAIRSDGLDCPLWEVTVCFGTVTDYFRAGLCMILYKVIWGIAAMVPVIAASILYGWIANAVTGILFYEVVILTATAYMAMVLRYYGAYLLLSESNTLGVWNAFRQSAQVFRGHSRTVIFLLISFAAWLVLVLLTDGFAAVYVYPYIVLSVFHLFRTLRPGQEARQKKEGEKYGI